MNDKLKNNEITYSDVNNLSEKNDNWQVAGPAAFMNAEPQQVKNASWWLLLPGVLAVLLLGAHYFRQSDDGMVVFCLACLGLLLRRRTWGGLAFAWVLFFGAWEWAATAQRLVGMRLAMGEPFVRGAGILAGVAVFTLLAGALCWRYANIMQARGVQGQGEPGNLQGNGAALCALVPAVQAAAFLGTALLLGWLRGRLPSLVPLLADRFFPGMGMVQVAGAAWYAAWVAGLLCQPAKAGKVRRRLWWLFCSVFFAQFALGLAGFSTFLMTGALHLPIPGVILFGPVFRGGGLFMVFLLLFALIVLGSAWCSHLCYFGGWDALATNKRRMQPLSIFWQRAVRVGRPVVGLLWVAVALGLRVLGVEAYVAAMAGVLFGVVGLGIMLFFSRRYGLMLHCTAYCPIGFIANLAGRVSFWRVRVAPERCTGCGVCERVCRYAAISPADRATGRSGFRCSLCRDCLGACRHGALRLGCFGLSHERATALFVVLVTVLHAVFLCTARV